MSAMEQTTERSAEPDELAGNLGIYLHVPFCVKRCHFCAFYLVLHEEQRVEQFLQALEREIALYARQPGMKERTVSTVYVGGGNSHGLTSWTVGSNFFQHHIQVFLLETL